MIHMKFGIICAGDIEFAPFIPMFKDCIVVEKAMLNFYCGKIEGKKCNSSLLWLRKSQFSHCVSAVN